MREDHFACLYVPGLLQTRDYTEAVQHASEMRLPPDEVKRLVDIRMKRQEILDRTKPPHVWAIIDESVIRRVVGSRAIMREQLGQLLRANDSSDITLQVLSFAKGAHSAAMGSFRILGGAEPSLDVVDVDIQVGSLFMEKEEELERYRLAFDYLRAQALDMAASLALIDRIHKELCWRKCP